MNFVNVELYGVWNRIWVALVTCQRKICAHFSSILTNKEPCYMQYNLLSNISGRQFITLPSISYNRPHCHRWRQWGLFSVKHHTGKGFRDVEIRHSWTKYIDYINQILCFYFFKCSERCRYYFESGHPFTETLRSTDTCKKPFIKY